MTEKRFIETISTGIVTDTVTEKEYNCEMRIDDDFLNLVNIIAEENEQLKNDCGILVQSNQDYRKENEQLKQQIKELEEKNENLLAKLKYTCEQINYSERLREMMK